MLKRTTGEKVFAVFNTIGLILLSIVFIVPVWHAAMGSISDPLKLSASTGLILGPLGEPTLGGYRLVMQNNSILSSYMNTLIYVVCATAFGTLLTILAAYVMSRKNLYFKSIIIFIVTFTMIFNGGLIPTYMVVSNLKMIDTVWAVIIPNCVWVYNMLIARTFFVTSIPDELLEASQIDGCTNLRFFFTIVVPLSPAIIAVLVLFYAVAQWNSFFDALLYIKSKDLYPLQIHLRNILLMNSVDSAVIGDAAAMDERQRLVDMLKFVLIIISCVPMFVVYPFVQKYFVKGVMIGAVKG